jgi:hypothetical protein
VGRKPPRFYEAGNGSTEFSLRAVDLRRRGHVRALYQNQKGEIDVFKFFSKRTTAAIAALVVAAVAGVGAYAFTASNTVPSEYAGAGNATIGHYVVTNVGYEFSPDATKIDGMSFDLDHPASDAQVALIDSAATVAAGDYVDCGAAVGASAPYVVTCDFSGAPITNTANEKLYIAAVTSGAVTLG